MQPGTSGDAHRPLPYPAGGAHQPAGLGAQGWERLGILLIQPFRDCVQGQVSPLRLKRILTRAPEHLCFFSAIEGENTAWGEGQEVTGLEGVKDITGLRGTLSAYP